MAKTDELTVDVVAKLTVSDETAKRCMALLEMWMDDNQDRSIVCDLVEHNGVMRHRLRIERLRQEGDENDKLPMGKYRPFDPSSSINSCNSACSSPYNEQCEFYHKEYHMGGYISTCLNQDVFGWCDCNRCPKNICRNKNA